MNEEECAALALLSRMRFACGDNGKRMQDELEEYLRGLKLDAERYRFIRDSTPEQFDQFEPGLYSGGDELDELTDAAMAGANA